MHRRDFLAGGATGAAVSWRGGTSDAVANDQGDPRIVKGNELLNVVWDNGRAGIVALCVASKWASGTERVVTVRGDKKSPVNG